MHTYVKNKKIFFKIISGYNYFFFATILPKDLSEIKKSPSKIS